MSISTLQKVCLYGLGSEDGIRIMFRGVGTDFIGGIEDTEGAEKGGT